MSEVALNLLVLRSADLDRAVRFYEALGIRFRRERHGSGPEHLAGTLGKVVLEIYPGGGGKDTAPVRLGLQVPSVDQAVAALRAAGAQVVIPPRESAWGRRAVVRDPDGHHVEVTEPPAGP